MNKNPNLSDYNLQISEHAINNHTTGINNNWLYQYSYPFTPSVYTLPYYDYTVRKVVNGWIVNKSGQEFIATTKEELIKLID